MKQSFSLAGYPAIRILSVVFIGAFIGSNFTVSKIALLTIAALLLTISVLVETVYIPKKPKLLLIGRRLNYLIVLVFVGFTMGLFHSLNSQKSEETIAFWSVQKWEEISFCGKVYDIQQAKSMRYLVEIDSVYLKNVVLKTPTLKVVVSIPETELISTGFQNITEGDHISAVAKILPTEPKTDAKDSFDQKAWLMQLGVDTRWAVQTLYVHQKVERFSFISHTRAYVGSSLARFFEKSPELEALAKAMILADKSLLSDETRVLYQKTGLSHVLAVSGFHVSMLLLPLWWFMPRFWLNNQRKWTYLFLASSLMLFYVLLTGSPASVQRATIMAWFLLVGKLWHLNGPPINMLAFAAIIMIARNPATVFDVGFQLSFAAVSSIFLVFQPLERLFSYDFRSSKWYKWLLSSLLFTFILQAAMFPLTAYYFGEHAHLGPIANLVYLPILTFCLFPTFIAAAVMAPLIPEAIINYFVRFLDIGYGYLGHFLVWLCHFPIATEAVNPPSIIILTAFLCLIISLNFWTKPRIRWRTICLALLCFNVDLLF